MAIAIGILFCVPLYELIRLALSKDLHSHILLIPFISMYLIALSRQRLPTQYRSSPILGLSLIGVGTGFLLLNAWVSSMATEPVAPEDALWLVILSFVLFLIGGLALVFGRETFVSIRFPMLFLFFMIPMPTTVAHVISVGLQHASADASYALFQLTGTPTFREGLAMHLPELSIEVAEECSGIRSSLVLFITSILGGHLFLRAPWKKTIFAFSVLPLGILRNAVRILTISLLTIHVDPEIIHGPLHHRGGPIYFVLSLPVLFVILLILRRIGRSAPAGDS